MNNPYYVLGHLLSPYSNDINQSDIHSHPWSDIIALANKKFLIPSLYGVLNDKHFFDQLDDEILQEYLLEMYEFNKTRNTQLVDQLCEIAEALEKSQIQALFLKGAAILSEMECSIWARRFMLDLDIMIHPHQMQKALEVFDALGYREAPGQEAFSPEHHHLPALHKAGCPAQVEIHKRVLATGIEYIRFEAEFIDHCTHDDFSYHYILNPTYRLYHAFLHTEIAEMGYSQKAVPLRHLYDFVVLAEFYRTEVDWKLLYSLIHRQNHQKPFESYLGLLHRLFIFEAPEMTLSAWAHEDSIKRIKLSLQQRKRVDLKMIKFVASFFGLYGYYRMVRLYGIKSFLGYFLAIIRHLAHQIKRYLFTPTEINGMLKILWNKIK